MKTVIAALFATVLLSACASTVPLHAGQNVTLQPAQSARLPDGSTLTYIGTANDSRCRPNVVCVWAGKADVQFKHADKGGKGSSFVMELPKESTRPIGNYTLKIVDVPYRANPPVTVTVN